MPKASKRPPDPKGWCEICQADAAQRDEPRGDLCEGHRYFCEGCLRANQRVTV